MSEAIVFELGKTDSHGAYDKKSGIYTFVRTGVYVYSYGGTPLTHEFRAGDTIVNPKWVCDKSTYDWSKKTIEAYRRSFQDVE